MSYAQVDRKKELPNLNNEELWHFIGDRGVYSESPSHMTSCFDVFVHSQGCLYYRMKPETDRQPVTRSGVTVNGFFDGVTFHDPMGCFINRKETGDEVAIMHTHYLNKENNNIEEADVLENETTIPFDNFVSLKFNP